MPAATIIFGFIILLCILAAAYFTYSWPANEGAFKDDAPVRDDSPVDETEPIEEETDEPVGDDGTTDEGKEA